MRRSYAQYRPRFPALAKRTHSSPGPENGAGSRRAARTPLRSMAGSAALRERRLRRQRFREADFAEKPVNTHYQKSRVASLVPTSSRYVHCRRRWRPACAAGPPAHRRRGPISSRRRPRAGTARPSPLVSRARTTVGSARSDASRSPWAPGLTTPGPPPRCGGAGSGFTGAEQRRSPAPGDPRRRGRRRGRWRRRTGA